MRLFFFIVIFGIAQSSGAQTKQSTGAEWTTLRGNNNRDGRVASKGEFKSSANLAQAIDIASSEALVEIIPATSNSKIQYRAGEIGDESKREAISKEWQTEARAYLDLNGDGKITKVALGQNVKYAKLFKGDKRYYKIFAEDGFAFGNTDTTFVGFRVYEASTDKLIFTKRFSKGVFMQRPHVLVEDMNNDGDKDIVITSWEGVYVFNNKGDSIAGLSQNVKGWHKLRKRGYACIEDVDRNGFKDVVIIGAYPYHLDVIKNDNGVLKFGWTEIFDAHIESAKKISRPILNSVSDFDGDGSYEILVNVFNYNGDNNWAGVLFDPINGNVKAQIRNAFVVSSEDLNGNGRYVFFCTETKNQSVPVTGRLSVYSFQRGKVNKLFNIDRGEWVNPRHVNISPTVTSHADGISSLSENIVFCVDYENSGQKTFFIKTEEKDKRSAIVGYAASKDGQVRKASLSVQFPSGMYGEFIRARKNQNGKQTLLLQVKSFGKPAGTIEISAGSAKNLGRYVASAEKAFLPVVADLNSDGQAEIVIPNDVGEILCFEKNAKGMFDLRWKVQGHGMLYQYNLTLDYGVTVDDLNHDGFKEVIVNGRNENGAALFAYDHKGVLVWQTDFPEINAGDVTTFDGNIAFHGTAQSSKRKEKDVIVTVQRVVQHTGKTYCLSGADGSVIWKLDTLVADRGPGQGSPVVSGAGGNIFATYDIDGDCSDEVMCGFGNIVFFADATDGAIKFKSFMRKLFMDHDDYVAKGYATFWIAEMLPVAFRDAGKTELSCFNTLASGTMNVNGKLSWSSPQLEYENKQWQCFANLDGDGKLWVVELSRRKNDGKQVLFAYDPVNGSMHRTFSIEIAGYMPVACDVNGDGKDEIVVSNDTGVHCVEHTNGKTFLSWNYAVEGCNPAVVADADGDGFVEVIAATRKGQLLIIDK